MEKPQNNQENFLECICPKCSLFTDCNEHKEERLFCARQKSECGMDASKMCICGRCKVFEQNKLTGGYFCIREITS